MASGQSQALGLEVSLSTLAREFGMARETISKRLLAAGVQPSGRNRGNDVYRVGAAARAIVSADYGAHNGPVVDPGKLGPQDQLFYYKAQNEKKKFDRESGTVIDVSEHEAVLSDFVRILLSAVEILPDYLERHCGLETTQLETVERVIDDARERLAAELEEYQYVR